jgi:hypothetical protein
LKCVDGKRNELDPRVMPSTKKTEKSWQKILFSAKPELARVGQRFQASAPDSTKHQLQLYCLNLDLKETWLNKTTFEANYYKKK